jgi:Panthothenate kinase
MKNLANYDEFTRKQWENFHGEYTKQAITDGELRKIKSLDDEISIDDVRSIYAPIRHLLHIYLKNYRKLTKLKMNLLTDQHARFLYYWCFRFSCCREEYDCSIIENHAGTSLSAI